VQQKQRARRIELGKRIVRENNFERRIERGEIIRLGLDALPVWLEPRAVQFSHSDIV
jgi:hypothetical protein